MESYQISGSFTRVDDNGKSEGTLKIPTYFFLNFGSMQHTDMEDKV